MNVDTEGIEKFKYLFKFMTAQEIMNENVLSVCPEGTMKTAKQIMKDHRISGMPVVNENNKVIGIISIEDVIRALETDNMDKKICEIMTKNPKTFLINDTMDFMMSCFKRFNYGRFPVVDEDNVLKGIITKNDILYSILQKFQLIHSHDAKIEKTLSKPISILSEETLEPKEADFLYIIKKDDIDNAGIGAAKLKDFLLKQNYDPHLVRRVGVSVYEAEVNVIIHSKSEGKIKCFLKEDHILARIEDYGIGIKDTQQAMLEGYTTAPDYIREIGFGAGMGLPNMKRCSDKMIIISQKDKGTAIDLYFFTNKDTK